MLRRLEDRVAARSAMATVAAEADRPMGCGSHCANAQRRTIPLMDYEDT